MSPGSDDVTSGSVAMLIQRFPGKADVCSQISLSTDHRRSGYVDERLIAVADFSN